jgi:signal transduction histidine kinase
MGTIARVLCSRSSCLAAYRMARSQVFNAVNNFKVVVAKQTDKTINPDLERWYAARDGNDTVEVAGASHSIYAFRSQGETVRAHLRKPKISDRSNILIFDRGVGLDLQNEPRRPAPHQLIEAERMSAIGRMACSISHDMRHSLTAIYANAEFLERRDICTRVRAGLLLEIQEAVLAMTERLDSLLQFGRSGRNTPLVRERVSSVVERAIAAAKFHPDGQNVLISVGKLPPAEAVIDARNFESAIYNLLLNACQSAIRSTQAPEVKVQFTEVDEQIYVTILDNGPGIPASIRKTLFEPFVTAGKPNGMGLGLTLARRIAEEHGGSVWLEESNQEWTAFTLSLSKGKAQ